MICAHAQYCATYVYTWILYLLKSSSDTNVNFLLNMHMQMWIIIRFIQIGCFTAEIRGFFPIGENTARKHSPPPSQNKQTTTKKQDIWRDCLPKICTVFFFIVDLKCYLNVSLNRQPDSISQVPKRSDFIMGTQNIIYIFFFLITLFFLYIPSQMGPLLFWNPLSFLAWTKPRNIL